MYSNENATRGNLWCTLGGIPIGCYNSDHILSHPHLSASHSVVGDSGILHNMRNCEWDRGMREGNSGNNRWSAYHGSKWGVQGKNSQVIVVHDDRNGGSVKVSRAQGGDGGSCHADGDSSSILTLSRVLSGRNTAFFALTGCFNICREEESLEKSSTSAAGEILATVPGLAGAGKESAHIAPIVALDDVMAYC
jgi:hypothetical protein